MTEPDTPTTTSEPPRPLRIAVVGPCASGKTTLVRGLNDLGYHAMVIGQEHSEIAELWRRCEPDVLVFLEIDIDAIRRRRSNRWPESILERQNLRLQNARSTADVVLDVSQLSELAVLAKTSRAIEQIAARLSGESAAV